MSNLRQSQDPKIPRLTRIETRHRMTRYGGFYGCSCGNVFTTAHTMAESEMVLRMHHQVVKGYEDGSIEDHLADEHGDLPPTYPHGQGIWRQ